MKPETSVVAAVDLSDAAAAVTSAGAHLARRIGGGCLVLHVVEALSGDEDPSLLLPALRRWVSEVRQQSAEDLRAVLAWAESAGLEGVTGEIVEGNAAAQVVDRARRAGARFVVVGGPGPGHLLGSTAERVVRRSPVPVLVVRQPSPTGYRNAVVGVDFSEGSARAWEVALELLEEGGRITACHVLETWGMPRTEDTSSARRLLAERLTAWVGEHAGTARDAAVRVEAGTPKAALLDAARGEGADLLAVGRRGRSGLAHLLLGSVAEAAARKAGCDVLVVGRADPQDGPP